MCPVAGCKAAVSKNSVLPASALVRSGVTGRVAQKHGSKIAAVVTKVKGILRENKDDRVLVFIQFKTLTDVVAKAFAAENQLAEVSELLELDEEELVEFDTRLELRTVPKEKFDKAMEKLKERTR